MLIIKIVVLSIIITLAIAWFVVMIRAKKIYLPYVNALDKKEFLLKSTFPFGLFLIDWFKYPFNTTYDRKLLNSISEIYGSEYASFYMRIFYANKFILIYLMIFTQLMIIFLSGFEATIFIYVLILFAVAIVFDDTKLHKRIKKRRLEIQIVFPEFINKLTLLLNAGLSMSKAWEKISTDNDRLGVFYDEVSKTVLEIKSGKNEAEAFTDFAKRLKTPEVTRLMSVIIQNIKKGGNELVLSLRLQSHECWEMRKNVIKRIGEEASTKLLFPMMIMFLAIIIIVVVPAILSMQGITTNF